MKLLYHPHFHRGNSDGLDNRRSDMARRWTDRCCYVREDDKEINRFVWKYLTWEFVIIGLIVMVVMW